MIKKVIQAAVEPIAKKAPEIIHEVNPVTWFERVYSQLNTFRFEKSRIEAQYRLDSQKLSNELEFFKIQKEAYLESLEAQKRIIETTYAPDMFALETLRDNMSKYHEKLDAFIRDICSSDLTSDDKKIIFELYKITSNKIDEAIKAQQEILQKNKDNLVETLKAVSSNQKIAIN